MPTMQILNSFKAFPSKDKTNTKIQTYFVILKLILLKLIGLNKYI